MAVYNKCKRNLFTIEYRKKIAKDLKAFTARCTYWPYTKEFFISSPELDKWVETGVPADMDCEEVVRFIANGWRFEAAPDLFKEAQVAPLEAAPTFNELRAAVEKTPLVEGYNLKGMEELKETLSSFTGEVVRINGQFRTELDRVIKANADLAAKVYDLEEMVEKLENRFRNLKVNLVDTTPDEFGL